MGPRYPFLRALSVRIDGRPLATSASPGSVNAMDGTPLVLCRTLAVAAFIVGAAASTRALAGPETPSFREQAACHKHREAGEHVQAAERCLAAYDALPDLPEALDARAVMAFDARYSFRDAYAQTGEVKHLCGEIRLMIRFLNYLDAASRPTSGPTIASTPRRTWTPPARSRRPKLQRETARARARPAEPEPAATPRPPSLSIVPGPATRAAARAQDLRLDPVRAGPRARRLELRRAGDRRAERARPPGVDRLGPRHRPGFAGRPARGVEGRR
jgi:hypothetical protein